MKRINYMAALAFALLLPMGPLLWQGCGTLATGADPVVVRAQQTRDFLKETAGAFFDFEYSNRAKLLQVDPGIKATADTMRRDVPVVIDTITATLTTYKGARTPANGAAVESASAAGGVKLGEVQTELAKAKVLIPK